MQTPYIHERQVEYWNSRSIEEFFIGGGFQVLVFPLTQLTEEEVPADFLLLDSGRGIIFGLRFKALCRNGDEHWNLDKYQHDQLRHYDWMYYGLSDMKEPGQLRNALHYLRVMEPASIEYRPQIRRRGIREQGPRGYLRWAAFFEGIRECKYGRKVNSKEELMRALLPHDATLPREISEIASEVFFVDLQAKRTFRFSRVIR